MTSAGIQPGAVIRPTRRPYRELLDELPPDHRKAIRSRKDLRRINRWMKHVPLLVEQWRENTPERWVSTIVEIGAGDGTFLLSLARALGTGPFKVILLD